MERIATGIWIPRILITHRVSLLLPLRGPSLSMVATPQNPWAYGPNSPGLLPLLYHEEKAIFAGALVGAVLYGIAMFLFFQCICALLDPTNRTNGGIKWGLVVHTTAMFLFLTIYTAATLYLPSVSFIDDRRFTGIAGVIPLGPVGYQLLIIPNAIAIVPNVMFILGNWLSDSLLLYRCYIVYAKNYLPIVFPGLLYLASLVTGLVYMYRISQPVAPVRVSATVAQLGIPHHSISVSLNILLTTMIVTRLVRHNKLIRNSMSSTTITPTRLYKAIITILIESCALFGVTFLLFIGTWFAKDPSANIFFPVLVQTQVIAPFLIISRIAKRSLSSRNAIPSTTIGSIRFGSRRESMCSVGASSDRRSVGSTDTFVTAPGGLAVGVVTKVETCHD